MLSLDIDSLKVKKYDNKDESNVDFYKNQAVSLNSNLAVSI